MTSPHPRQRLRASSTRAECGQTSMVASYNRLRAFRGFGASDRADTGQVERRSVIDKSLAE